MAIESVNWLHLIHFQIKVFLCLLIVTLVSNKVLNFSFTQLSMISKVKFVFRLRFLSYLNKLHCNSPHHRVVFQVFYSLFKGASVSPFSFQLADLHLLLLFCFCCNHVVFIKSYVCFISFYHGWRRLSHSWSGVTGWGGDLLMYHRCSHLVCIFSCQAHISYVALQGLYPT